MSELLRKENETIKQYKLRLFRNKATLNINKDTIAELINKETENNFNESTYRKWFASYEEGYRDKESEIIENSSDDTILKEYDIKLQELYKEKIKFFDQRRDLNERLRKQSREEYLYDLISDSIKNNNIKPFEVTKANHTFGEDDELIIALSDLHYGLTIKNEFEVYNTDVFLERLASYYLQILDIKKTHKSNKCHVTLLGDAISGVLHNVIRVANSEDVVTQVQKVSEYIANFLSKIANEFEEVNVYYVSGNHSRNFQDKKESINSERLENFIPWYLKVRLGNFSNLKIHDSKIDNTVAIADIKGHTCYFTHGDNDNSKQVAEKLTMMFEKKPLMVMFGHMHHFQVDTLQKVKLIMSGSFCVNDEYCLNKRIIGEPSQTVVVINDKGVKCLYDCKLN